jgi:hypothetical protein
MTYNFSNWKATIEKEHLMCDNVMITAQDHIKELQIRVE